PAGASADRSSIAAAGSVSEHMPLDAVYDVAGRERPAAIDIRVRDGNRLLAVLGDEVQHAFVLNAITVVVAAADILHHLAGRYGLFAYAARPRRRDQDERGAESAGHDEAAPRSGRDHTPRKAFRRARSCTHALP